MQMTHTYTHACMHTRHTHTHINVDKSKPDGAGFKLANELVGTGFSISVQAPKYIRFLKAQWVGVRPLQPLSSH